VLLQTACRLKLKSHRCEGIGQNIRQFVQRCKKPMIADKPFRGNEHSGGHVGIMEQLEGRCHAEIEFICSQAQDVLGATLVLQKLSHFRRL